MKTEDVIKRFKEVHGETYDYSEFEYTKMAAKAKIICRDHGVFYQTPHSHLKGQGCPICGKIKRANSRRDTTESFIVKAKKVHGDRYDYSKVKYEDTHKHVTIVCPKHGEFSVTPGLHLNNKCGCPECYSERRGMSQSLTKEEFIEKARNIHGNKYDYSKANYMNTHTKVCIICPEHGEFWQEPASHLSNKGCPQCGLISRSEKRKLTTEEFINRAKSVHGNKYDYSKTVYNRCNDYVDIICPTHGLFKQIAYYHLDGNGCQQCAQEMTDSSSEKDIYNFIAKNYEGIVLHNCRNVLENGFELDVYLPDKKLAFEFDGLYWHNEIMQPNKNYHLAKTKECESKDIQLIHIFEDEWLHKQDIVKSRILNLLGKSETKIYARKCTIKEIDSKTSRLFLTNNHIQGYCNALYKYGLYYNDELVSVMTFGKMRKNLGSNAVANHFELLRFCNKLNTTVVGGASKLLNHFIKKVSPEYIISYADRRWSMGKLYEQLGFSLKNLSQPSYFYVINDKRENRFKYRKDVLVREGYDASISEHQIMLNRGIYRIYDCGCRVYEYKKAMIDMLTLQH